MKEDTKQTLKEVGVGTAAWFYGVLILCITVAVISVGSLYLWPLYIHKQTEMVHNSNSYAITGQTSLVTMKSNYDSVEVKKLELRKSDGNVDVIKALEGQQAGIIRQMKQTVGSMNPKDVPVDIKDFLATH